MKQLDTIKQDYTCNQKQHRNGYNNLEMQMKKFYKI